MKYQRLYSIIKEDIINQKYALGEKLPTEHELSALGYSRNTVRQALALLEQEGIIVKHRGSGSVVHSRPSVRKQTKKVAIIADYIQPYLVPDVLNGISEEIRDWAIPLIFTTENKVEKEAQILKDLHTMNIDGIIATAFSTHLPTPNVALYQSLIDAGIPVVFMYDAYIGLEHIPYVTSGDLNGGIMAAEYLYSQGRTKIGGIFSSDSKHAILRYNGVVHKLTELKLPVSPDRMLWITNLPTYNLFAETFSSKSQLAQSASNINIRSLLPDSEVFKSAIPDLVTKCDALICDNDLYAFLVIDYLIENGVKVPEDMAVLSFDNTYLCNLARVPITSFNYDPFKMGQLVAQKIKNMLDGMQESPTILPWTLSKRQSS